MILLHNNQEIDRLMDAHIEAIPGKTIFARGILENSHLSKAPIMWIAYRFKTCEWCVFYNNVSNKLDAYQALKKTGHRIVTVANLNRIIKFESMKYYKKY